MQGPLSKRLPRNYAVCFCRCSYFPWLRGARIFLSTGGARIAAKPKRRKVVWRCTLTAIADTYRSESLSFMQGTFISRQHRNGINGIYHFRVVICKTEDVRFLLARMKLRLCSHIFGSNEKFTMICKDEATHAGTNKMRKKKQSSFNHVRQGENLPLYLCLR